MKNLSSLRVVFAPVFFCFTLLCLLQSWALHIVDIDQSEFGKNIKHVRDLKPTESMQPTSSLVRLFDFDVEQQEFDVIAYYFVPSNKNECEFIYKGIKVTYGYKDKDRKDFSIKVDASNMDKDTWCFSIVEPKASKKTPFDWTDRSIAGRFVAVIGDTPYLDSSGLRARLEKLKSNTNTPQSPFKIKFLVGGSDFESSYNFTGEADGSIYAAGVKSKDELGTLGELATDVTFFAHRFVKLPSKMKGKTGKKQGNTGFDGVYINSKEKDLSKRELWVVESKFTETPLTPGKMKGHTLPKTSEGKNLREYELSKDKALMETALAVIAHVKANPKNTFFLGYNVMSNGKVRTHFFDLVDSFLPEDPKTPVKAGAIILEALTPQSPLQDQEAVLRGLLLQFSGKTGSPIAHVLQMVNKLKFTPSASDAPDEDISPPKVKKKAVKMKKKLELGD